MSDNVRICDLMHETGVKFGTSGARGLVSAMTDRVCYALTAGFLQYLETKRAIPANRRLAIAADRRPSSPRILGALNAAAVAAGYTVINAGRIPTPALALYGLQQHVPTLMVTGSHIPDDRNGIKFTTAQGEILKRDEEGILEQTLDLPTIFDADGMLGTPSFKPPSLPNETADAANAYHRRYTDSFPPNCLAGFRIGLYGHSAVGRDLIGRILSDLGATVEKLGYSESFIPVDTEAVRDADVELAHDWAKRHSFDCIVSTDGDSDRPLISDETGRWLRGDITGILCARYLAAESVVTPVSSNTAVEACDWFQQVIRTRIGSPYVIFEMQEAMARGAERVVGYEANGGFLTGTPLTLDNGVLAPLPTRDPVIVMLSLLMLARRHQCPISGLIEQLPRRFTESARLQNFPIDTGRQTLDRLGASGKVAAAESFGFQLGNVASVNTLDGLRLTFENGEIVHLRPSGNAPELRCYAEASSPERAKALTQIGLEAARRWVQGV